MLGKLGLLPFGRVFSTSFPEPPNDFDTENAWTPGKAAAVNQVTVQIQ
jgi:hypothetical protein